MIARQTRWPQRQAALDLYTLACGVFLLIAPWLFGFVRPLGRLDAELVGLAVIALSIAAIFVFAEWEEWLKVLLGAWLIAAPWLLGFAHTSAMHVSIAMGLAVAFLALLELWVVHDPDYAPARADSQQVESSKTSTRDS
jgi:hypothetical protein